MIYIPHVSTKFMTILGQLNIISMYKSKWKADILENESYPED